MSSRILTATSAPFASRARLCDVDGATLAHRSEHPPLAEDYCKPYGQTLRLALASLRLQTKKAVRCPHNSNGPQAL